MNRLLLILLILFYPSGILLAQYFYRIEADISIKTKAGNFSQLTMGRVFYDINIKKLVYNITFPEKEVWVVKDSVVSTYVGGKLVKKTTTVALVQSTIFHLALEGRLSDYGLSKSLYKITKVEKDGDMVITTYSPPPQMKGFGDIAISTKNKSLYGVVFFSADKKILSKQIVKSYTTVSGLKFPAEIIQIYYKEGKENYQVMTFKNIKVNNQQNESFYRYPDVR